MALVAVEHLYILVLEKFLWTNPRGRKAFGLSEEFAHASKGLAANQGLYNGFLAAGLFWSLLPIVAPYATMWQAFFLGFVLVAAVFRRGHGEAIDRVHPGVPAALALLTLITLKHSDRSVPA